MKTLPKIAKHVLTAILSLIALSSASSASAITVDIDPTTFNRGWVSNSLGAGFWDFSDLSASHDNGILTLGAVPINDPDPFWFIGGGGPGVAGRQNMSASSFTEVTHDFFSPGEIVTFNFEVLSNTFVSDYTVVAFILDLNINDNTIIADSITISDPGTYSLDYTVSTDPRVNGLSNWGFTVYGPNVWPTDLAAQGNIQITNVSAVPVPAAAWLFGSALIGLVGINRKK